MISSESAGRLQGFIPASLANKPVAINDEGEEAYQNRNLLVVGVEVALRFGIMLWANQNSAFWLWHPGADESIQEG